MARDSDDANAVGHNDMLALTNKAEASPFQSLDGIKVIDTGNLRHDYTATSTSRTSSPFTNSSTVARYSLIAS